MKKFVKIRGLDEIEGACWNLGYGRIRKHKRLEIVEFRDIKVFGVFGFVEDLFREKRDAYADFYLEYHINHEYLLSNSLNNLIVYHFSAYYHWLVISWRNLDGS